MLTSWSRSLVCLGNYTGRLCQPTLRRFIGGVQVQRLPKLCGRLLAISLLQMCFGQVKIGLPVVRIVLNSLRKARNRLGKAVLALANDAEVVMGESKVGHELDCLLEMLFRVRQSA